MRICRAVSGPRPQDTLHTSGVKAAGAFTLPTRRFSPWPPSRVTLCKEELLICSPALRWGGTPTRGKGILLDLPESNFPLDVVTQGRFAPRPDMPCDIHVTENYQYGLLLLLLFALEW